MSQAYAVPSSDEDGAFPPYSEGELKALVLRAQELNRSAHETRSRSREIVACCVEGRIEREDRSHRQ